ALRQEGVSRHVTVLDQGSCAPARARVAAFVDGRPDVTLLAVERNLGVPGGRNRASAFGHGDAIAGLDNDAEFAAPDTLARAREALAAAPRTGVLGCRILTHASAVDDLSSWGYPAALLPRAGERFDAATFVGAGHVIRRAAWESVGGYDSALFFCWEEFDLSLRLLAAGWAIRYHGDLAVTHKVSGEHRVHWSGARWYHHVRNRLYIGRKFGAGWVTLSPRVAAYLAKGWRNGRLAETRRAIADAARMPMAAPPRPLPAPVRAYLQAVDRAPRGSWHQRLRREVLAPLDAAALVRPAAPCPATRPEWAPDAAPAQAVSAPPDGVPVHAVIPTPSVPTPSALEPFSLWERPADRFPRPVPEREPVSAE
ncbi:MAG: glycosyltransferase, partial [Rhodospirillales bacterium]|nr:glycosyltransferase [Rhodospirillales bacterium]